MLFIMTGCGTSEGYEDPNRFGRGHRDYLFNYAVALVPGALQAVWIVSFVESTTVLQAVGLTDATGTARLVASVGGPLLVAFRGLGWSFVPFRLCSRMQPARCGWLHPWARLDGQKGHPKAPYIIGNQKGFATYATSQALSVASVSKCCWLFSCALKVE